MSVQERVSRGAALLAERNPEWREYIIPGLLNLGSQVDCILGQLYGTYSEGTARLFEGSPWGNDGVKDLAREHGFHAEEDEGYDELTREWLRILGERETVSA